MQYKQQKKKFKRDSLLAGVLAITALPSMALPLANQPIFLGTNAPANVLFLVDDSGSMDFEVATQDSQHGGAFHSDQPNGTSAPGSGSVKQHGNCGFNSGTTFSGSPSNYGYFYGIYFPGATYKYNPCDVADEASWRFRNHDFNPLYYNPAQEYTPWAGTDANGNDFGDIDPTDAPDDPYHPVSNTIDLTTEGPNLHNECDYYYSHGRYHPYNCRYVRDEVSGGFRYYTWNDKDKDQKFDNGEETEWKVANLPDINDYTDTDGDGKLSGETITKTIDGQSVTFTYPNSKTNFANWFSYYRSRALLAKNAYGKVIADARNVRMGLVTINDNNSINTAIRDMDDAEKKQDLLDQLYNDFEPNGGTPLRSAMNKCGEYLACKGHDSHFPDGCPALSADKGGNCQQNFLITMTDGYYNGDSPGVGNTDGDDNSKWDGGPYADNNSDTLGDIAMHYYERDLQPDLDNDVIPIKGLDEATHQHVVSYTVAFGVNGTLSANPSNTAKSFDWPDPSKSSAAKIDDLRHAAFNGRGLYLDARDPTNLANSLRSAIADIGDRTSAAAAVALNSGSLNVDTGVFQARFDSSDWSGQMLFFPVSNGSGNTAGCSGNEARGNLCAQKYDAGVLLDSQNWDTGRVILTENSKTRTGIAFRYDDLSETQQEALQRKPDNPNRSFNTRKAKRILDYLRGDRRRESNANWRTRSTVLGDIIHSDPVYVGPPVQNYDLTGYAAFRKAHADRTPAVYVGANDGMLHAFNAKTGKELFAYVPASVYPDINRLAFSDYNQNHQYFVDAPPVVGDAYFGSAWHSVLVGGLRGGGQGVYALDVTDPADVSESKAASTVLWEFTDADDPNLGYTYSQPSIVRMANGKWAALVSSGYNNTDNDGHASSTGLGYLFILYLSGPGSDGKWDLGTDYQRIALPAASGNTSNPAGIATPAAVSIDSDPDVEYIYVGDLNGNMWRIDTSSSSPVDWSVAFGGNPLFVAKDADKKVQPITVRPEVGAHPAGLSNGLMVYFGTGRFLTENDNTPNNAQTQSLYGIWDEHATADDDGTTTATPVTRSSLLEQQILSENAVSANAGDDDPDNDNTATTCNATSDCFRLTTDNQISYFPGDDGSADHGWYMDLIVKGSDDNRGERQVSTPILRDGRIFFTTLLPSGSVCAYGGDSFLMILDADNGGRLGFSPFDVDDNNKIDHNDYIRTKDDEIVHATGRRSQVGIVPRPAVLTVPGETSEYLYTSGSDGGRERQLTESGGRIGRILWRQLR